MREWRESGGEKGSEKRGENRRGRERARLNWRERGIKGKRGRG